MPQLLRSAIVACALLFVLPSLALAGVQPGQPFPTNLDTRLDLTQLTLGLVVATAAPCYAAQAHVYCNPHPRVVRRGHSEQPLRLVEARELLKSSSPLNERLGTGYVLHNPLSVTRSSLRTRNTREACQRRSERRRALGERDSSGRVLLRGSVVAEVLVQPRTLN